MRPTQIVGFSRVKAGVYPSEYDESTPCPGLASDFISPKSIEGMDSDSYHIAGLDLGGVEPLEAFIDHLWISVISGGGGGENVKPPRRNNPNAKREVARIHQVHGHKRIPFYI
jgi:hypothetical protein